MAASKMQDLFSDFPSGPLSVYRDKASFDWRKLKLAIDGEELIRYKNDIWAMLQKYGGSKDLADTLPVDDQRLLTQKRVMLLTAKAKLPFEEIAANPKLHYAWCEAVFMYDLTTGMAHSVPHKMFYSVVKNLGTERHQHILRDADENKIMGCFALTEVAHGSNAKGMRTTATFDPKTKEWVLNSENFEAAKCWVGLLGKRATHAVVFAKLISVDGKDQGLHSFVVPIRCTKSLRAFPGLVVGDMGEKMALNGMDNGFLMFNSYRIPAANLLNQLGDVDDDGNYFSPIENPSLRFAMSFSVLSSGRVQIGGISTSFLQKAITIAIRYSAVRKQFGPDDSEEEFAVLEYQQQQFRLIPYLAAALAMGIFSKWFMEVHSINEVTTKSPAVYLEIHALSSATKPSITWTSRDGIQVCREACGGHGYLKAAGIGDLRGENDANCTYEGENSLLLQQTSNWLLSLMRTVEKGDKVTTPLNTVDFLNDMKAILSSRQKLTSVGEVLNVKNILSAYRWLICYTLKNTSEKVNAQLKQGKDKFSVRNDTQSFYAVPLSLLLAEYSILRVFHEFVVKISDSACRSVMLKLAVLYGACSLEKHLGTLYIGGYFSNNEAQLLRDGIVDQCRILTPDAVALVDTIAPPDFILNSVLGNSNGMVYQNLQAHIFSGPDTFSRPTWWKEVAQHTPSKL